MDIGAYERRGLNMVVNTEADATIDDDSTLSLRDALNLANGEISFGELSTAEQAQVANGAGVAYTVAFASSLNGSTITLSTVGDGRVGPSAFLVNSIVAIDGPGGNSGITTGDNAARCAEDIGGQELSYAEVKAIASGNPAVLTLAEADAELQRLSILKKNHADEQYLARRNLRDLPKTIASLSERLAGLTADMETAAAHAEGLITISDRTCTAEEAPAVLAGKLESLPHTIRETRHIPLGSIRGLRFGIVLHQHFEPDVYLEGAARRQSGSLDHHGPRAILNAVERLINGYGSECTRLQQDLAIAETQLRDYQARFGQPFLHEAYLSELTVLRDRLKVHLSGMNPEPATDPQVTASELAEQIKALKAAHTVEPAPERIGRRGYSAEEPVTARIRRRLEAVLASKSAQSASEIGAMPPEKTR